MRLYAIILSLLPALSFAQPFVPGNEAALYGALPRGAALSQIQFTALGSNMVTTAYLNAPSSAACQPHANSLILCFTVNSLAGATAPTNVTGCGLQWVQILNTNYNGGGQMISVWRAMTNALPPSGIVTNWYAAATTGIGMRVVEFTNVDLTGTYGSGAIVQSVKATNESANATLTLSALDSSGRNAVIGWFGNLAGNGAAWSTPEAGWTEASDTGYNTPATGGYCVFRLTTTDNTVAANNASGQWAGIAIEIKASSQ